MSNLPGNPFAERAEKADYRSLTPATLALTYEQRTANLIALAQLCVSIDGQRKFIDVMAEFAKCGVTPEQLLVYVDAFARLIVTGTTPEHLNAFARQTLLNRAGNPNEGLHHITREYRGAR